MTSTDSKTDTSSLSDLDFSPKCSAKDKYSEKHIVDCPDEAKYYAVIMKCGSHEYGEFLTCENHLAKFKMIDIGLAYTWCETCNCADPYLKEFRRL